MNNKKQYYQVAADLTGVDLTDFDLTGAQIDADSWHKLSVNQQLVAIKNLALSGDTGNGGRQVKYSELNC